MKRSALILVINFSVLFLIVCIGLATQVAPYFTFSLLGLGTITFLYILTEQWMTHDAVEFENRFWTAMAFGLASACLFCSDSPIQLAHKPELAWIIVVTFTFLAHNYDRHLQRLILTKATNIRRIRSQDFCPVNRTNAHEKVVELRKLLSTIDHVWMSSTFLNFFFLYRVLSVEHKIITIIAEANSDELNLILNNIELALLFYKMKDHKFARRFNRTDLLKLLAVDRVNELVISSRVVLLDSLQRMKLSAHPQCEQFVANIISATKTDELSELKTLMDNKGDINNMHKLLYSDIRNPAVKESILKYIAHQADIQAAHSKIGSKRGKQRGLLAWRKVLSDVDDTLTCSGGSWPAGMDTSYPKKAVYPGVLAFYRELDLGTVGADEWDKATRAGNLAFLSARPHVYKGVSENVSYAKFKTLQQERGLYTSPTLLAGSLDTGGQFMVKGDSEPLALKKFENFREYLSIYPEYTCIFVGDNGQGDVRTAELMLQDQSYGRNLQRVYVHQVQPRHLTYCRERDSTLQHPRIHFFGTYVDAALDAYKHKLIRANGLRSIMEEACRDFLLIPDSAWVPTQAKNKTSSAAAAVTGPGTPNRGRSPSLGGSEAPLSVPSSPGVSSGSRKHLLPPSSGSSSGGGGTGSAPSSGGGAALPGPFPPVGKGAPAAAGGRPTSGTLSAAQASASGIALGRDQSSGMISSTGSAHSSASSLSGGRESPSIPLLTRSFLSKTTAQFTAAPKKQKTGALPGEGLTAASMGYCRGGGIVRTFTSAAAEASQAERRRELRLREINTDLERGNAVLSELRLPQVDYLAFPCRYSVGTSVSTMFGEGIVTKFRPEDGIYEVLVGWEAHQEEGEQVNKSVSAQGGSAAAPASSGQGKSASEKATTASLITTGIAGAEQVEAAVLGAGEEGLLEEGALHRESSASAGDLAGLTAGRVRGGIKVFIAGVAIHS